MYNMIMFYKTHDYLQVCETLTEILTMKEDMIDAIKETGNNILEVTIKSITLYPL